MSPILTTKDLTFSYGKTLVLHRVSIDLFAGEILALVGPNGAGKTTLLRLCSGMMRPQFGEVFTSLFGPPVPVWSLPKKKVATRIAMLESNNDSSVQFTVKDMVSMGRYPHESGWGPNSFRPDEVNTILEETQLLSYAERRFCTLSRGQQQRVWMAMCLAQSPRLWLLDEPMASLDLRYQYETMSLLKARSRQGMGIFLSIHDLSLAAMADRVVLLSSQGEVLLGSPADVLTESVISDVFQVDRSMFRIGQGALR